jgi:hypothetical protein
MESRTFGDSIAQLLVLVTGLPGRGETLSTTPALEVNSEQLVRLLGGAPK